MPRYIDADILSMTDFEIVTCDGSYKKAFALLLDKIANAPTADVVERKDLDTITEAHEQIGYEKGYRDGYAQGRRDNEPIH